MTFPVHHWCQFHILHAVYYSVVVEINMTGLYVIVNVQFEKGIRDIFVGVFVSSCVSNEKQTHPQKYL